MRPISRTALGAATAAATALPRADGSIPLVETRQAWHAATTAQQGGRWSATVDHADATGKSVTLRTELTDANGNSVVQTVDDAYAVR
ncbi:hypothetical protein [Streptomyces sp. NPDC057718]|uniref:hypothetical protein n=1 Tax=Streptomyces sp. NPDC057718 TaxID=3346225 RepID=UPI0036A889A0